jgi:hypothetical protein
MILAPSIAAGLLVVAGAHLVVAAFVVRGQLGPESFSA